MNITQAQQFSKAWIDAWNAHDLDRILSHYADDFEMSSPIIRQSMAVASGTLTGRAQVAEYWGKALQSCPDLHFTLRHTLLGANSVTIIYDGVRGLSSEVFFFNGSGKVCAAAAHYLP